MDIKQAFGDRLREQRMCKGITQKELANMLGVRATNLNNWEKGLHLPQAEYLCEIAKILGVSIAYLYGQTENSKRNV